MANNPQKSYEVCNAEANAAGHLMDGGYLRYFDGAVPVTANASLGSAVLMAELVFSGTAFQDATNGAATANALSPATNAKATGDPTFFRTYKADGTSVVLQGTIGQSGCDINIPKNGSDPVITIGVNVACDSFVYAVPRGA